MSHLFIIAQRTVSPTFSLCFHQPLVDCYVNPLSGSHLMTRLCPSLYFLISAMSAPETREPAAASANPATGRLQWTHGEPRRRDLGPWGMNPWKYGAKLLGVGRWRLIFFMCSIVNRGELNGGKENMFCFDVQVSLNPWTSKEKT